MNDAMREKIAEIEKTRHTLACMLHDLEPLCDHKDENGEKSSTYDANLDVYLCSYCGYEWGLNP